MKKTTLWFAAAFLCLTAALNAQVTITDFEASGTTMTFGGWNGSDFMVAENPDKTGLNTSDSVGVFMHSNNNWWAGIATVDEDQTPIDLSATPYFTMNVHADKSVFVMLKLEGGNDGAPNLEIGYQLGEDQINKWVEVKFSFLGSQDTYNKVVMFIDPADLYSNEGSKYYFDDLKAVATTTVDVQNVMSPKAGAVDVGIGSKVELFTNLHLQLADGSAVTADNIASAFFLKKGTEDVAFSAEVKVDAGMHKFILTPAATLDFATKYTYGLIDDATKFAETGIANTGKSYEFTTVAPEFTLYNDFEAEGAADALKPQYDMNQTENIGTATVVEDPKDAQNKVAKWTKSTNWGGWERVQLMLDKPLDINKDGSNLLAVDVLVSKAGPVKLKLTTDNTNGDNGTQKEVDVDYTTAGEWQTLFFDISGDLFDVNYDNIFIYFRGGTAEADTLYFDNVRGVAQRDYVYGVDSFMIYDFETKGTDMSGWDGSSKTTKIENPHKEGINMSDSVGEYIPGNNWVGTGDNIGHLLNFEGTPYMKMKVWSSQPIMVMVRAENDPDYGKNKEVKVQLTADQTGQWTELFFNFEGVQFEHLNKVLVFFDPDGQYNGDGEVYYFDDLFATDKAPDTKITLLPEDASTDVSVLSTLKIVSNLNIRMSDDSEITNDNVASTVILKKTDANGADVAFTAKINEEKTEIMVTPSQMLEANTSYYFGLIDDVVEHAASNIAITGEQATITTGAMFETVMYEDFDGNSVTSLVEAMGDPAGAINTTASNPADPSSLNFCAKWEKGSSWGGWERIHIELEEAVDFSKGGVFSMKVYSPIKTYVRFKVADRKEDGGMIYKELDADITKVNEWDTLYIDFSKMSFGDTEIKHLFIYIAGGAAEAQTFYVDDIQGPALVASSGLTKHIVNTLAVSPNPVKDVVYINGVALGSLVEVYNLSGAKVMQSELTASSISVAHLEQGMYFVKVGDKMSKIVKE